MSAQNSFVSVAFWAKELPCPKLFVRVVSLSQTAAAANYSTLTVGLVVCRSECRTINVKLPVR